MFINLSSLALDYVVSSVGDTMYTFSPVQYIVAFVRIYTDLLMDRMALVITSFLMGMIGLLAAEIFLFWSYFNQAPVLPPPRFTSTRAQLPEVSF